MNSASYVVTVAGTPTVKIIVTKGGGPVLDGRGYSYFVTAGPGYTALGHASTRWGAKRVAHRIARGLLAQIGAANALGNVYP